MPKKITSAQELVDLKRKLVEVCPYPWEYIPILELAFLCGIKERSLMLEAIAIFYDNSVEFITEFLRTIEKQKDYYESHGSGIFNDVQNLRRYFDGRSLIEYSPEWEAREKKVLTVEEITKKGFVHTLANYPKTVAWHFDCSIPTVTKFVDDVSAIIRAASNEDLVSAIKNQREIDPRIKASVAFRILTDGRVLQNPESYDNIYRKVGKSLECLPLEYTWSVLSVPRAESDLSVLDISSNFGLLDKVMKAAITAHEYGPKIEVETDWKKLENLYREFYGFSYTHRKQVLLRMIDLCS